MSATTCPESDTGKEVAPPPIVIPCTEDNEAMKTSPPPLSALCSESITPKEDPVEVSPSKTDEATSGALPPPINEKSLEEILPPKQDSDLKPITEINKETNENKQSNVEEQKATELGNTVGDKEFSELKTAIDSSNGLPAVSEKLISIQKTNEPLLTDTEKEDTKEAVVVNPEENIQESQEEVTNISNVLSAPVINDKMESNEPEDDECVNVQELTAHVMNLLNEGIANESTNQHDLLKKNIDLQEFIIKLIHLLKEKTELCANLDRQNSALTSQAKSLKDVIAITKDLLGIRNMEVERLHADLNTMEDLIKAERNRYNTSVKHLNEAMGLNSKLKSEYLTQMDLFQKLKDKYTEKVVILTKENIRFKSLMEEHGIDANTQVNGNATPNSETVQAENVDK